MTLDERCHLLHVNLLTTDIPEEARVVIAHTVALEREAVPDSREARLSAFEARQAELPALLAALPST